MWNLELQDLKAQAAWPILVERARQGKTIYYGDLAAELGTDVRSLKFALEVIQTYCRVYQLPHLTAVVVKKNTNLPGPGCNIAAQKLPAEYRRMRNFTWEETPETLITKELQQDHESDAMGFESRSTKPARSEKGDYWLLQANPAKWDIFTFLKDGHEIDNFSVSKNKKNIKPGDKFILWLSGRDGGAIGWGHFLGSSTESNDKKPDKYWKTNVSASSVFLDLKMNEIFIDRPISRETLKNDPVFSKAAILEFANGGNAFPVTPGEWKAFQSYLSKDEESRYGEKPGFSEGSLFASRDELRKAGLYSQLMHGISFKPGHPADAIVLPGEYAEDKDEGRYIVYTGQGGRDAISKKQVRDQELSRGNLALVMSRDQGIPIRVIRGSGGAPKTSPGTGYRYDGLYLVEDSWMEKSKDGPRIIRFGLRKVTPEDQGPWASAPPVGNPRPEKKVSGVIQRIVRNTKVTQWVKDLHGGRCQFCGVILKTVSGPYSEGAHIKPLGGHHSGPDTYDNVLSLCPNCHTLFDNGTYYVNSKTMTVHSVVDQNWFANLIWDDAHPIDVKHLNYHRKHIAGVDH